MAAPRAHRAQPAHGEVPAEDARGRGDLHQGKGRPARVHQGDRARRGTGPHVLHLRGVLHALPRDPRCQEGGRPHHAGAAGVAVQGRHPPHREGQPSRRHAHHARRHVHRDAQGRHAFRKTFERILRQPDSRQHNARVRTRHQGRDPREEPVRRSQPAQDGHAREACHEARADPGAHRGARPRGAARVRLSRRHHDGAQAR